MRAKVRAALALRDLAVGVRNGSWKGDGAGYDAFHKWAERHFTDSGVCERCGSSRLLQWACRITGVLTRERAGWLRLCVSCHIRYDIAQRKTQTP